MESIITQTWKHFEYIVIDGGSNDESFEIIENNKSRIDYWVSEKDNGIYQAMNKGIINSNGKYLLFINSGDYLINENVIEKAITELNDDFDFVCGNLEYYVNNVLKTRKHPKELTFSYLCSKTISHPSTFIKRELFNSYGLYNENLKIVSDWAFFFKTLGFNGATYKSIDMLLTHFDMNGISSNNIEIVRSEKQIIFKKYLPYIVNNENDFYIFDKFRETNKRFKLLQEIDKSPFFRKITTFQLTVTILLMKLLKIRKYHEL